MKISTRHLRRYKEITVLLWRYGRSDLVRQMTVDESLEENNERQLPASDANPMRVETSFRLMGYPGGHIVFSGRGRRRALAPDQHLCPRPKAQDKIRQVMRTHSAKLHIWRREEFNRTFWFHQAGH